jgi:hypothetical protein
MRNQQIVKRALAAKKKNIPLGHAASFIPFAIRK